MLCDGLSRAKDLSDVKCRLPTYPLLSDWDAGYIQDRQYISAPGLVCLAPFLEKEMQRFDRLSGNSSAIQDEYAMFIELAA